MLGRFGGAAPPREIFAKLNKVRTPHVAFSAVAECSHNICFYDSTEFGFSK